MRRQSRPMASIKLHEIAHCYNAGKGAGVDYALKPLNQSWDNGGAYALLGPSGCGKTTLLNIISGLLRPSEGRVLFDEKDITDLTTEQRNIAQVFQFPVVYDTLSVAKNLAFPLQNRGLANDVIERRVAEVLQMLGMQAKANLKARGLNADDKQKISLGRGLVRTDVEAILFDEPLTVIDPHLKWQLRTELKKIHQQFQHTMIYVTHDQTEALTFADKVIVMYEGAIVQIGTPEELFEQPKHTFVGKFIGSPGMNVLPCELQGSDIVVNGNKVALGRPVSVSREDSKGLELGIRPEYVRLSADSGIPVDITGVEDVGKHIVVRAKFHNSDVNIILREGEGIPGNPGLIFEPSKINLYQNSYLVGTV